MLDEIICPLFCTLLLFAYGERFQTAHFRRQIQPSLDELCYEECRLVETDLCRLIDPNCQEIVDLPRNDLIGRTKVNEKVMEAVIKTKCEVQQLPVKSLI